MFGIPLVTARRDWRKHVTYLAYTVPQSTRDTWAKAVLMPDVMTIQDWDRTLPGLSEFAVEMFARLYDKPVAVPIEKVAPEAIWAVKLHAMLDGGGFKDYCSDVQGNAAAAYQATVSTVSLIAAHLPSSADGTTSPSEVLATLQLRAAALQIAIDEADDDDLVEQLEYDLRSLLARINSLLLQGVTAPGGVTQEYAEALAAEILERYDTAIQDATKSIDAIFDGMSSMGFRFSGSRYGGLSSLSVEPNPKARFEFAKRMKSDSSFLQMAELIGKLRLSAAGQRATKKGLEGSQFSGMMFGDDISALAESEMIRLADPETEKAFDMDYKARMLALDEKVAESPADAGGMAILVDMSGSMSDLEANGFDRLQVAMAMAIAALEIAANEYRPAWLAIFDDDIRYDKSWSASRGIDQKEMISLCKKRRTLGGTNFPNALEFAMSQLEGGKIEKDSHILMITDGQDYISPDWAAEFRARLDDAEVQLHVLLIGGYTAHHFDAIAERVILVGNLNDPASADLFAF